MTEEDSETVFQRHKGIGSQVKQAYEEAIGQMFANLNRSELDVFEAIFKEHEDYDLDTENLFNRTRNLMTKVVLEMNRCFFASNDVDNKLTTLEMLKEHFAPYEGKDWNFNTVSPEKLTRPLRMRHLDFSIGFMEGQLKSQEKQLEIAMAKSIENRERLQDVQNKRVKLKAKIEQQLSQYQNIEPQLNKLDQLINNIFLTTENK
ncbi:uncharacterized protein LOC108051758 [Drosophila rhopaloa]|uniref:Protein MIS12 homolog n=1 Tax=Drosophila rhopaloa TaxID=1041015 RepID=A0ABM5I3I0_DRORH|nr:uncharacterized protein LOC108051758 [Drosophila rhopaloa]